MLALPLVLGFLWWRTARVPATFYLWLATVGRSEAAYQQASAAFVADFTREPQRRVIQAAMRRLHAHLAAGDRVYIVTAANESLRSEEHTSELQSLMRISYAVFCLKKKQQ